MQIEKDFKEFIVLLNEHQVKYLVVGGYAVNYHGYPRYTRDIDFWIWLDSNNIDRLLDALHAFGFGSLGLSLEDFSNPNSIIQLGHEPFRIDLMMQIDGVHFGEAFERREERKLEGVKVNFIALPDLIESKKAAGRFKDLADAEELNKIQQQGGKNDNNS